MANNLYEDNENVQSSLSGVGAWVPDSPVSLGRLDRPHDYHCRWLGGQLGSGWVTRRGSYVDKRKHRANDVVLLVRIQFALGKVPNREDRQREGFHFTRSHRRTIIRPRMPPLFARTGWL